MFVCMCVCVCVCVCVYECVYVCVCVSPESELIRMHEQLKTFQIVSSTGAASLSFDPKDSSGVALRGN